MRFSVVNTKESDDVVPASAIPLLRMLTGEAEDYLLALDALRHLCVVGYKSFAHTLSLREERHEPSDKIGDAANHHEKSAALAEATTSPTTSVRRTLRKTFSSKSKSSIRMDAAIVFNDPERLIKVAEKYGSRAEFALVEFFETAYAGRGKSMTVDDTILIFVRELGVIYFLMESLDDVLNRWEDLEDNTPGSDLYNELVQSTTPLMSNILQVMKCFTKVQSAKNYLASPELNLIPLLGSILTSFTEISDDVTSNTLACMENLSKYVTLSRPLATEIRAGYDDNAYFGEQDAMNFLKAMFMVCLDHVKYDADMQTRAYACLVSLAAKSDDNCAFLLDPNLLKRERKPHKRSVEHDGIRSTLKQQNLTTKNVDMEVVQRARLVSTRNRQTASARNDPTDNMSSSMLNAVKKVNQRTGGDNEVIDEDEDGEESPVLETRECVELVMQEVKVEKDVTSVVSLSSIILHYFITGQLLRSRKNNMFSVFDTLHSMARCDYYTVGETLYLSPISRQLLEIIAYMPDSEQSAKAMTVFTALATNPWVQLRILETSKALNLLPICVSMLKKGNAYAKNATLLLLINITATVGERHEVFTAHSTKTSGIDYEIEDLKEFLGMIYRYSKVLATEMLRPGLGLVREVLVLFRNKELMEPVKEGKPDADGKGRSTNSLLRERCMTLLSYLMTAALDGFMPKEDYKDVDLDKVGLIDFLDNEVVGDLESDEESRQKESDKDEERASDSDDEDEDTHGFSILREILSSLKCDFFHYHGSDDRVTEPFDVGDPHKVDKFGRRASVGGNVPVIEPPSSEVLSALQLVAVLATDPNNAEALSSWPGMMMILSVLYDQRAIHPLSPEGIARNLVINTLLSLLTIPRFPAHIMDANVSSGKADFIGQVRAMGFEEVFSRGLVKDKGYMPRIKASICLLMVIGADPVGIVGRLQELLGDLRSQGVREKATDAGGKMDSLGEVEAARMFSLFEDLIADVHTFILATTTAKRFVMDEGAEGVIEARKEWTAAAAGSVGYPRPSHAFPRRVNGPGLPNVGRPWMSADLVIKDVKTDSATAYREKEGSWDGEGRYLNASIIEGEGRGIPVMTIFAAVLEVAKGDGNKSWLCRPRIIGSIVDFLLYCYEVSNSDESGVDFSDRLQKKLANVNRKRSATTIVPKAKRSDELLGLSVREAERGFWMLTEALLLLTGSSFAYRYAPFTLMSQWFPGKKGEMKLHTLCNRLKASWSALGSVVFLNPVAERRRRLCGLLFKRLTDAANDINFVSAAAIEDAEVSFLVASSHLPLSRIVPRSHAADLDTAQIEEKSERGRDSPSLHITMSYSQQARAMPTLVESFAELLGNLLNGEVWTYGTGSSRAGPTNSLDKSRSETLQPREQELYTKDERLLRSDAVRHAMDCSHLIIIVISEEYQSCPLLREEAEHAITLSKLGCAKVFFMCSQPYYCPFWDKDPDETLAEGKSVSRPMKGSAYGKSEPCKMSNAVLAALALLPSDPRLGPGGRQLFHYFMPPCKPHKTPTGWLSRMVTQGSTWFALWSEQEAERLPAYVQAHSRKGLPGGIVTTGQYYPHLFQ